MNKNYSLLAALLLSLAFSTSSCSVYMAAAGDEEPNLSNVHRGASRGEVELSLGHPTAVSVAEDGSTIATYQYTIGNKPSVGRAVGHGVLDVLTFGIWEVVGTPIEAFNQGDVKNVTVTYDASGNVSAVN